MAFADSTVYTTVATLQSAFKKTSTKMMVALKKKTEEYEWLDDFPEEDIIPSGYEMRLVLDVLFGYGGAMIPDGGYEDQTGTAAPQEGTFVFVQHNKRFGFTTLAQAFDRRGRQGMVERLLTYQAEKALEATARKIGIQTYGFSTGTVAQVSGTPSGTTGVAITLKNVFGSSLIPVGSNSNQKTYAANLFRPNDNIGVIHSGSLVSNSLGTVQSVSTANGTITVDFEGAWTGADGDSIVFANAVTDTTINATDYNRWPVGFLDALTSSSVHGLATSTAANWAAGFADTSGGRWSAVRTNKLKQGLYNNGAVELTDLIWSNGVYNDVMAGERAAMIYQNSTKFNLDGDVGAKGIRIRTSVLAPPGLVIGWNRDAYAKLVLTEKPSQEGGPDLFQLDKAQDRAGFAASMNFIYSKVCRNRAGMGYASGLTEQ